MSSSRKNSGNDTLIPMTARHLVTDAQLALDRHIHLDHLEHPRREFVPPLEACNPLVKYGLDDFSLIFEIRKYPLNLVLRLRIPNLKIRATFAPESTACARR